MLTIFAIPRPFKNHIETIQRKAIISWTLLRPRPEIILFSEEEGTAGIAAELGPRHEPHVERNKQATKYLNAVAQQSNDCARSVAYTCGTLYCMQHDRCGAAWGCISANWRNQWAPLRLPR